MDKQQDKQIEEKLIVGKSGYAMLAVIIIGALLSLAITLIGVFLFEDTGSGAFAILVVAGIILLVIFGLCSAGFKILAPNEAYVLTIFGKYYGTLKTAGFFWVNPFCVPLNTSSTPVAGIAKRKLSLKAMTLNNDKQKVNDIEGNPIEIGVVAIWRIKDTAKAIFNVENYMAYVSTQCDSAIRQIVRQFPYDVAEDGDEKSLRGSSQEVAEILKIELQERVDMAGIEILEARISNLAYAPEIAAAMLQRQQAAAIIAARQKIVDGAVSMVEMALKKLSDNQIVELDDERKAAMVSNLLVVLCGNRDAQPVINSGSLY